MDEALAQTMWEGAPPPAITLSDTDDYEATLARLRQAVGHGLPVAEALQEALRRWTWSIDLGWLMVETTGDIVPLAERVAAQGRRFGTLAWALWRQGQVSAALAVLDDPAVTQPDDRRTRAELRVLADLDADSLPGDDGLKLSYLVTWRRHGGAALAQRFDAEGDTLPAHPPLFALLIDAFVAERDFARARAALAEQERRCGPDAAAAIRLALESGDAVQARGLLDTLPSLRPWRWSPRRMAQDLRCRMLETSAAPEDPAMLARAEAGLRLHPRDGAIKAIAHTIRERCLDWDVLADTLTDPAMASALIRLGLPQRALDLLATAPPAPPDEAFRQRLRRAEALLRLGQVSKAAMALGPPPVAAPLSAEHAWWRAEIALAARDLPDAEAALGPALRTSPTRMGLHLSAARLAFLRGDGPLAEEHLATFRALKTVERGTPPPDDLRDRIVADLRQPPPSPAHAARAFALAVPAFAPVTGAPIPPRIAHYWEGPRSLPVERGLRAWARQFPQTLFDAPGARAWLAQHAPDLVVAFDAQPLPATRADLFRIAWLAREGGLFADLDEYPRGPVAPWLEGARAVLVIEEGHGTLANNFLAALPGLPLFARLQARIADRLAQVATPYPWWDTGPAQLTLMALPEAGAPGMRFLTQAQYDGVVATNLPFPHKSGPGHWR